MHIDGVRVPRVPGELWICEFPDRVSWGNADGREVFSATYAGVISHTWLDRAHLVSSIRMRVSNYYQGARMCFVEIFKTASRHIYTPELGLGAHQLRRILGPTLGDRTGLWGSGLGFNIGWRLVQYWFRQGCNRLVWGCRQVAIGSGGGDGSTPVFSLRCDWTR